MTISACPKCGSRNFIAGTIGDGVLTGYTTKDVFRDCGYQGNPIVFDSEKEYNKFLEGIKIKGEKPNGKRHDDKVELTQKEKELLEFLNEPEKKKPIIEKTPYGLIILVYITILSVIGYGFLLIFPIIALTSNPPTWYIFFALYLTILIISLLSSVLIPYGFFKHKKWAWTFSGILFVLGAPITLPFVWYLTRPHVKKYFNF